MNEKFASVSDDVDDDDNEDKEDVDDDDEDDDDVADDNDASADDEPGFSVVGSESNGPPNPTKAEDRVD